MSTLPQTVVSPEFDAGDLSAASHGDVARKLSLWEKLGRRTYYTKNPLHFKKFDLFKS